MKFKKDGKVFEDIRAARYVYCQNANYCRRCDVGANSARDCIDLCKDMPAEAARLMGYEVVEDGKQSTTSQVNQPETVNCRSSKPLRDWTLGEAKEYCENNSGLCNEVFCPLKSFCDFLEARSPELFAPGYWALTEKPRFTPWAVGIAKGIVELLTDKWNEIRISRCHNGTLLIVGKNGLEVEINKTLFPSIRPMQSIKLSDIVGGST